VSDVVLQLQNRVPFVWSVDARKYKRENRRSQTLTSEHMNNATIRDELELFAQRLFSMGTRAALYQDIRAQNLESKRKFQK
jgi:hypothetical protein